jgi:hypothetical protein
MSVMIDALGWVGVLVVGWATVYVVLKITAALVHRS